MRIIFMGTPSYAAHILRAMISEEEMDVVAVFTQPDKPVGRKRVMTPPEVKVLALEHNITTFQPARLRDAQEDVLAIETDFIVVAAYGQILPKAILEHAPCINLHASILPQYRGASPIQQSLLHGDKRSGVTAMRMDEGLDTGDILRIEHVMIEPTMLAAELYETLSKCAASLTLDVLRGFDTLQPRMQDESQASHCKKIKKEDGLIVFDNAEAIYNRYRAFHFWPGVFLDNKMKIKQMELVDTNSSNEAGQVIAIDEKGVVVGCTLGAIRILEVQPASKKAMRALDYLNGKRLDVGHPFL